MGTRKQYWCDRCGEDIESQNIAIKYYYGQVNQFSVSPATEKEKETPYACMLEVTGRKGECVVINPPRAIDLCGKCLLLFKDEVELLVPFGGPSDPKLAVRRSEVTLQRSTDGGTTWQDVETYTAPVEKSIANPDQSFMWRLGVKTGDFTSGQAIDRATLGPFIRRVCEESDGAD